MSYTNCHYLYDLKKKKMLQFFFSYKKKKKRYYDNYDNYTEIRNR